MLGHKPQLHLFTHSTPSPPYSNLSLLLHQQHLLPNSKDRLIPLNDSKPIINDLSILPNLIDPIPPLLALQLGQHIAALPALFNPGLQNTYFTNLLLYLHGADIIRFVEVLGNDVFVLYVVIHSMFFF